MAWGPGYDGSVVISGLSFLFLWLSIGFGWVYRDAKRRGLSAPKQRGLVWGWLGLMGVFRSLRGPRGLDRGQRRWLGGSVVLVALWLGLVVGARTWPGLRAWAPFAAGLYVLYWQFAREATGESATSVSDE